MIDVAVYALFFVLILVNTGVYVLIGAYFDGTLDDLDKMHEICEVDHEKKHEVRDDDR